MTTHPEITDVIPPELAADEQPFTLEQLDRTLHVIATYQQVAPDEPHDDAGDDEVRRWSVTDMGSAEWAMSHLAAIAANQRALDEQRQAYMDRINRWHEQASKRLASRAQFFEGHLTEYAAQHRALDPKRNKTLALPSGVVKSTEAKPTATVVNEAEVITWARDHLEDEQLGEVVQTTEKVMLTPLRKLVEIAAEQTGWMVTLECGHVHQVPMVSPVDGTEITAETLATMPCDECPADPIDGYPVRASLEVVPHTVPVVVHDGEPVPGTEVRPTTVTYKVVPS